MNNVPSPVSIIIPTYNEAKNILHLIDDIQYNLDDKASAEIIVVDDNSPDETGRIVEDKYHHLNENVISNNFNSIGFLQMEGHLYLDGRKSGIVKVINRVKKRGLISAVLDGIEHATSEYIVVMDADFSHPTSIIPKMIDLLKEDDNVDIVIASRYEKGGSIKGWPIQRKLISIGAVKMAEYVLGIRGICDPISGFFAFKRHIIKNIDLHSFGYKILLEILIKAKYKEVKEIPYTFKDREIGESKLGIGVMVDYVKAVSYLYRYKKQKQKCQQEQGKEFARQVIKRESVFPFLSKASKFFIVGASGLLINYFASYLLSNGTLSSLWYVKATLIGILLSMTSNFLLNKIWTFQDKNFSVSHTLRQYGQFAVISSFGAAIQLVLVYLLVQSGNFSYEFALISAVAIASISNFILNKKWTFKEKIWS